MKTIRAFWHQCGPNFGDLLTKYWIEKLDDVRAEWTAPEQADLCGAGSIIELLPVGYRGTILGSGMMRDAPREDLRDADIRAVRGPLTANNIGANVVCGDLGLLFQLERPDIAKQYAVGIIPHYADCDPFPLSYYYVNITAGVDHVVAEAAKCERIISSSLHGIILADALGIVNQWKPHPNVVGKGFKFRDYAASLGENIEPGEWRLGDQERVAELAASLRDIAVATITER